MVARTKKQEDRKMKQEDCIVAEVDLAKAQTILLFNTCMFLSTNRNCLSGDRNFVSVTAALRVIPEVILVARLLTLASSIKSEKL